MRSSENKPATFVPGFNTRTIYRNARGDGTIQVPPDVPNQSDANLVLNVRTG